MFMFAIIVGDSLDLLLMFVFRTVGANLDIAGIVIGHGSLLPNLCELRMD